MKPNPRKGYLYRRWRERVIEKATACAHCGQELDKSLPYRDPETGRVNLRYPSADHIVPISHGGSLLDPANGQAVCLGCNRERSAGGTPMLRTSEDW